MLYASLTGFARIDKPESCYLFIKDTGNEIPSITLESTKVNVQIDGVIADVCIKQSYVNKANKKLEAVYVFPGSTRAAVYGMTMQVGKRKVIAEIKEKQQAREEYEKAREKGKTASLLEQRRPNVFQMNVANIAPGDTISIEVSYTELLEYTGDLLYEFVYPGLVGPRYDTGGENWVEQTHQINPVKGAFDINVEIRAGMNVDVVKSSSHEISISHPNNALTIKPAKPGDYNSGKDFILQYGLQGAAVQSGILTYKHKDEDFFLLMVQPPKKIGIDEIAPREYIFIVDVSGSMYGFPLEISKQILRKLISSLRPTDRFNVMLFESSNAMLSEESLSATVENIEMAIKLIEKQRGAGGTELYPALKKAFAFKTSSDFARTFIIATDGYVTVEKEAFELTRQSRNKANLFVLGIGDGVNRYLIEGLAYAGGGQAYIVNSQTEANEVGKRLIKDISTPVLSHIEIEWNGFMVEDVTPSPIADLFEAKPVIVYGKYKGDPVGSISIKGITGNGNFSQIIDVARAEKVKSQALRYLWARDKIKYLSDYAGYFNNGYNTISEEAREKIIALGLNYNLMTEFTSFLAVNTEIIVPDANTEPNIFMVEDNKSSVDIDIMEYIHSVTTEEDEPEENIPFAIVEERPTFMGSDDISKFQAWVQQQIKYPVEAVLNGIQGTVYIQFTIDIDGSVKDVKILRSVNSALDNEAVRVIKLSPKWVPAKQRNKAVQITYYIPVRFILQNIN
jgi:Ca-activated chloride channel family protein